MNVERTAVPAASAGRDVEERIEARVNQGLLGHWYVIAKSADIATGTVQAVKALGTDLVVWRDAEGRLHCLEDRCPHRGARLSHGRVRAAGISCSYHGVTVDGSGAIAEVPALGKCGLEGRAAVKSYPVREMNDGVFAYFASVAHPEPRDLALPVEITRDPAFLCTALWPCNYRYAVENLADPMHGIYLHSDSFTLAHGSRQDTVDLEQTAQG